jgi:hypothetical protein
VVDGGLVTFDGTAAGPLHAPAQPVVQQRPHVRGMVADPVSPLDHRGDAVQGPQLARKPVGDGALQQGLLNPCKLLVRQERGGPRRPEAYQRAGAAGLPALLPSAGALPGDTKLAGDLDRMDPGGKQLRSP